MKKAPIGLFYGSSTCYTEMAAEKIQRYFSEAKIDLYNVADTPITTLADYQLLILGIPTWDYGELQEDWEDIWEELDTVDLSDKMIALFGLGDQVGYPDWFLDAMGYLHNKVVVQGAQIVGHWPNEGYEFNESQALTDDKKYFLGLALDDENEFDKTDLRIHQWCEKIKQDFVALLPECAD